MAEKTRKSYATRFIKSDIDEAVFLGNPMLDNLMTTVIALGSEVWTNRRRMRIIEAMLAEGIAVTNEAIEQYQPSDEQEATWQAERDQFIEATFGALTRATKTPMGGDTSWADPSKKREV